VYVGRHDILTIVIGTEEHLGRF